VKEIEEALLAGEIDLAVHSSKDLPASLPDGLAVGSALPREDPADVLVLPEALGIHRTDLEALPVILGPSARIGTGSVRRIAQLRTVFPGARFLPIRGNIDTRLRKLDRGEYDLVVLAAAGLWRLGFGSRISVALPPSVCVPAPGQGIIAIEVRADDRTVSEVVGRINDEAAATALAAERALVLGLGGGCQMPIGALALPKDDAVELQAIVASLDGGQVMRCTLRGSRTEAAALGADAARLLLADGAREILEGLRSSEGRSR